MNAIGPGPIANRMMQSLEAQLPPEDPASMHDSVAAMLALQRFGINEEVAHMALFLAGDDGDGAD